MYTLSDSARRHIIRLIEQCNLAHFIFGIYDKSENEVISICHYEGYDQSPEIKYTPIEGFSDKYSDDKISITIQNDSNHPIFQAINEKKNTSFIELPLTTSSTDIPNGVLIAILDDSRCSSEVIKEQFLRLLFVLEIELERSILEKLFNECKQNETLNLDRVLTEREGLILDTMADSYILGDMNGNIQQVNKSYSKLIGYSKSELLSMNISQVEGKLSEEEIGRRIKEMSENGSLSFETTHIAKDGKTITLDVNSIVVLVEGEPMIAAFMRDVTEKKQQENQFNETLYQLNLAQKISHIGSWEWNMVTDEAEWSDEMYRIYGVTKGTFYPSNENVNQVIFEEDRYKFEVAIGELLGGKYPDPFEFRIKRPDGETRSLMILAVRRGTDERQDVIYGVTQDITDTNAVQLALNEKVILLKEIHHRVKNNLQIVSSLLSLQSKAMGNENLYYALQTSRQRVESIALVHEKLYQNYSLKEINFKSYIEDLIYRIFSATSTKFNVRKNLDLDDVEIELDKAVPTGLIINEMLSNCFKYAFDETIEDPLIEVSLKQIDDTMVQIKVHDNGLGFTKDFDELAEGNSLGFMLIKELSDQIDADLKVESGNGSLFELTFKIS